MSGGAFDAPPQRSIGRGHGEGLLSELLDSQVVWALPMRHSGALARALYLTWCSAVKHHASPSRQHVGFRPLAQVP